MATDMTTTTTATNVTNDTNFTNSTDPDSDKSEYEVTPWKVSGKVDYNRLIVQFGTEKITDEQIVRIEKLTGQKPHTFLARGQFFSHRALDRFLDAYENGEPVFIYTGRGPTSEALHIGHTVPMMFTVWLQKAFNCPCVIQMADDEKYAFKDMDFQTIYELGKKNAVDMMAFGFLKDKTFFFSNRDYRLYTPKFEVFVSEMKTKINTKDVAAIFGFDKDDQPSTVAMYDWPFYQSAAAFSNAFPHIFGQTKAHCLVAYAIDQDPYFRMARSLADKMNLIKPYSIMCTFIPPLTGTEGKMSSSVGTDASIFLTDDPETVRRKVMTYAFSGGGGNGTLEEHRKFGGNPAVDISYQYLRYFEEDDQKLAEVYENFKSGVLSCADMKSLLCDKLVQFVLNHQKNKAEITEEVMEYVYSKHEIDTRGRKVEVQLTEQEEKLYQKFTEHKIEFKTKYHRAITTMEEGKSIATSLDGNVCKNIFLKGDNHGSTKYFLLVTGMNTDVKMRELEQKLGVKRLRFVDSENMETILRVPRGCVTVFALNNIDFTKYINIEVLIDKSIDQKNVVNFHPLRNDATVTISYSDMINFIDSFGVNVINV